MRKKVCEIITMCAFLCISPVNASATSFDNINEMLNKINGEDGFVEASECVIDKNTKSLHLSVVINETCQMMRLAHLLQRFPVCCRKHLSRIGMIMIMLLMISIRVVMME